MSTTTNSTAIRLGYKASAEQFSPGDLAAFAIEAEQHGFESVWISDHFQPWRHVDGHAPSAIVWLSHVAARTERIVLGTSVLTPTLRYHPGVIAQQFGTLGALHPGRVILGVGTGEALNESVLDIEFPDPKERFARLREAVRLIRQLWSKDRVDFDGDYYRLHDATIYDRPSEPVPIYIAGAGPGVTKYAGRVGDGYICTSGKGLDLYTETLLPALAEGIEANDRDPASVERTIEIKVSYDRDRDQALENCRFWAPLSLSAHQKAHVHDPREMARLADELPIEEVAKRWIVSDDPDEVTDAVKAYVDLGFTHLVFHGPGFDQHRFVDQFAADVLPRLRELGR